MNGRLWMMQTNQYRKNDSSVYFDILNTTSKSYNFFEIFLINCFPASIKKRDYFVIHCLFSYFLLTPLKMVQDDASNPKENRSSPSTASFFFLNQKKSDFSLFHIKNPTTATHQSIATQTNHASSIQKVNQESISTNTETSSHENQKIEPQNLEKSPIAENSASVENKKNPNVSIHFDHCSVVFNTSDKETTFNTTQNLKQPETIIAQAEKPLEIQPSTSLSISANTKAELTPTPIQPIALKKRNTVACSAEVIYWQVIQDHLLTSIKANGINTSGLSSLTWVNQRFDYDPGVRVSIGGFLPYDEWDLSLSYTFLKTSSSQHSKNPNPEFYMVLSGHMQSRAQEVKSIWDMLFQSLDIMLGRPFKMTESLMIKPQLGLKGTYPNQKWHVTYIRPSVAQNELIFANQRIQNFFWGLGPNLGLDVSWQLPKKWAVKLKPSWSLICSKVFSSVEYSDVVNTDPQVQSDATVNGSQQVVVIVPQMELWMGAEWAHPFGRNRQFKINFGYDVQYFWNEANILAFVQLPQGSLMLHGATLGFHFDF